ncbi:MAG TPA: dTDP-4-dehydrorhamnose reductase [Gracilimonas sp.]|uniref:dTDP-4-dehydrorhamnose reductase n=1 Tax=Gracilimonas sp. TaxID=1974203 RepID=UPI002D99BE74|nr:dTDP-4-dehydrorhamnose reductase [Gracilimonas sp.]
MRILITGGNGQLGNQWVNYLNKQGVEFISLPSSDLDITDHEDVRRVLNNLKPNHIINCAAYTNVDNAETEKEKAFAVNAYGVKNLADYCASKGIKLVHFSTDYVFSGTEEDHVENPKGYTEHHPTNPVNVYGESKLAGEKAILESDCNYLIIRISWLCGKYGQNFVKTMLRLASERDELSVVNDQYGCPTFAENVVKNTWELSVQNISGIYHLSSLGKITWFDFAKEIFTQSGSEVNLEPVDSSEFPTKAKRPAFSLLNTQKIANIPNISLINWKEGLKNMLAELES